MGRKTRFRAYQLGSEGSSFSYCDGITFTLIEARLTDTNRYSVAQEMKIYDKTQIDVLHITSWDKDHCEPQELVEILCEFTPKEIEYPAYQPTTDSGKSSLACIKKYEEILNSQYKQVLNTPYSIAYIKSLNNAERYGFSNIIYHPYKNYDSSNDNSSVKFFRSGSFTLLSLGDVELAEIAEGFIQDEILTTEVDIMILAHHGADNGFTSNEFLKAIKPTLAICSSNYDNKFNHPKPEIRQMLYDNKIDLFTTKTGDCIVESIGDHKGDFQVVNLISNNTKVSTTWKSQSKLRLK